MHQLIYISTAQRDLSAQDLETIITASQQNNARDDVTGLLLFDGRRFLQALEGADEQVSVTFERIKSDPRHRALVMLSTKTIERRQFGEWSMSWQRYDPTLRESNFRDAVDAATASVADPNTRELFRGFARIDRKAA